MMNFLQEVRPGLRQLGLRANLKAGVTKFSNLLIFTNMLMSCRWIGKKLPNLSALEQLKRKPASGKGGEW
jgi:hypothetical protein